MSWRESGCGYKETSSSPKSTSALPPKADILRLTLDFRSCEGLSDACRMHGVAAHSVGRRRTSLSGGNRGRDQARWCGRFGLWGFDGGRVVAMRCVVWWIARIRAAVRPAGWICDDFAVALAGLAR